MERSGFRGRSSGRGSIRGSSRGRGRGSFDSRGGRGSSRGGRGLSRSLGRPRDSGRSFAPEDRFGSSSRDDRPPRSFAPRSSDSRPRGGFGRDDRGERGSYRGSRGSGRGRHEDILKRRSDPSLSDRSSMKRPRFDERSTNGYPSSRFSDEHEFGLVRSLHTINRGRPISREATNVSSYSYSGPTSSEYTRGYSYGPPDEYMPSSPRYPNFDYASSDYPPAESRYTSDRYSDPYSHKTSRPYEESSGYGTVTVSGGSRSYGPPRDYSSRSTRY